MKNEEKDLLMNPGAKLVAQVSKPAVSPISKSADRVGFGRANLSSGTRVWKPAIQQTWKSAPHRVLAGLLSWRLITQGSSCVATLGWMTESLWDSGNEVFVTT
jgi:hypothetical protein